MLNILFVCSGNTCRSPMAEAIFNDRAKKEGIKAIASSAGVMAGDGFPASAGAISAMEAYNIDLSRHRSRQLTDEILAAADAVYCMSGSHVRAVKSAYETAGVKVKAISKRDIADPFGGDLYEYEEAARQIYEAVGRIIVELQND